MTTPLLSLPATAAKLPLLPPSAALLCSRPHAHFCATKVASWGARASYLKPDACPITSWNASCKKANSKRRASGWSSREDRWRTDW